MWEAYANCYAGFMPAAVVFAACAPLGQRLLATVLALALGVNWVLCGLPYIETVRLELALNAPDLWSLLDATLGALAITLTRRWWSWALWVTATCQVCFHLFHGLLDETTYTWWLDQLLRAQIAVFLLLGGRGVYDWLSRLSAACARYYRLVCRTNRVLQRTSA